MEDEESLFVILNGIADFLEQEQGRRSKFEDKLLNLINSLLVELKTIRTDVLELSSTLTQIETNTAAVIPPSIDDD